MRWVLVTTAVLMAGFAGALFEASRHERTSASRPEVAVVREHLVREAAPQIDDRQLDAIAERLASRLAARQPRAVEPPASTPVKERPEAERAPEPTPEQRAAAEKAEEIVAQALARRSLAPEDVNNLRQLGPRLPRETQDELRMRMIRAINQQELAIDPRAGLP